MRVIRHVIVGLFLALASTAQAQQFVNQGQGQSTNGWPWRVQGVSGGTALNVNTAAQTAGETTQVCVTNAAGGTLVPTTALAARREILIQNLGPNAIFCTNDGSAPLSTGANGMRIDQLGGWFAFPYGPAIIITCIAATAVQVTPACAMVLEAS